MERQARIRTRVSASPASTLVAYGACFAAIWAFVPFEPGLRVAQVLAALVLEILVCVLLLTLPAWQRSQVVGVVGVVAFLASVALLRDGVGARPGYGPLALLPVVWASLHCRRRELWWAIAGVPVVLFGPILLIGGARYPTSQWLSGWLLVVLAAVLGVAVLALVHRLRESEERHRLAAENATELLTTQQALREIATLVATGAPSAELFSAVAEQIARLFHATAGGVVRFDGPSGVGETVGGWSCDGDDLAGQTVDLAGTSSPARVYQTGAPAQISPRPDQTVDPAQEQFELRGAVCAPIVVEGRLWGSAGVVFAGHTSIPSGAAERVTGFAELVAVAIANAQARETLVREALTDPVTGLANHRAFHERLRVEVERASRHDRAVSVALFDLDHFKAINDTHGHQAGDGVLAAVARRLAAGARAGELVARIGGEEFAWLMPETTEDSAYLAADRARRAIAARPFERAGSLTISAGVASNLDAPTAHEILDAADQALYNAKRNGRNATFTYAPDRPAPIVHTPR